MPRLAPRMFPLPALLIAQVPTPPAGGDAWDTYVASLRIGPAAFPKWRVIGPRNLLADVWDAPSLRPSRAASELTIHVPIKEATKALSLRLGWNRQEGWALLDPEGAIVDSGQQAPTAERLLSTMKERGWVSRADQRAAFLREHPEHGSAWEDELREAMREAVLLGSGLRIQILKQRPQLSETELAGLVAARVAALPESQVPWKRIVDALRALRNLPDSQRVAPLARFFWPIYYGGGQAHPPLVQELSAWRGQVETALGRNPVDPELWDAVDAMIQAGALTDPDEALSHLEPAPGSPWPIPAITAAYIDRAEARNDGAGLLERAERGLVEGASKEGAFRTWAPVKLRALLLLNRDAEAKDWIREARAQVSGIWPKDPAPALAPIPEDQKERIRSMKVAFATSPERAEPPALPLQLVDLGSDPRRWEALKVHPAFDAWSPHELVFTTASPEQGKRLREQWPEARWVLLRGPQVLDQGPSLPSPEALHDRVLAQDIPHITRLEGFLRTHPDHLQAQEQLRRRLDARMPHPRLELRLVRLCEALGEAPVLRTTFLPQLPLWETAARRALPEAEARLRRWPEEPWAWEAWFDWARVHPVPASPTALLSTLAIWKSRRNGGEGPLPLAVVRLVSWKLEQSGRWLELEAWTRAHWEDGWAKALPRLARPWPESEAEEMRLRWRGELAESLLIPRLAALDHLGHRAEAAALRWEVQGYGPLTRKRAATPTTGP